MMSDKELQEMGFTREEWNKMLEEENQYIEDWAKTINPNDL
jgi:hypothetical protein